MIVLDVEQGSQEWLDARWMRRCASEAPIVMGASRFMTRAELVRLKATGGQREFSDYTRKRLLEKGHETEAKGRTLEESMIGEQLFPITATDDSGLWLASFDGMSGTAELAWEHKLWNDSIADQIFRCELEPEYYWQLEHQARVCGLATIRFACSDGTADQYAAMDYVSEPARQKQLEAAWEQFEQDVANYQHVEVLPAPTAAPIATLPELEVTVVGEVRSSNLATWSDVYLRRIADIKEDLQTDQDFADAEKTVKFLEDGEKKLEVAEARVLSQTGSIDEVIKTVRHLKEQMRAKRLTLSKRVTTRKESIRAEIIQKGRQVFDAHILALNVRIGRSYMPQVPADFAGAIRSKKTVQSVRDAVDGELARAKRAADEVADRIQANLATFGKIAKGSEHQFPDLQQLVQKAPEDFEPFVQKRIHDNWVAEERRLEAERARAAEQEKGNRTEASTLPGVRSTSDAVSSASVGSAPETHPSLNPAAAWPFPPSREQLVDILGRIVKCHRLGYGAQVMGQLVEQAEKLLAGGSPAQTGPDLRKAQSAA